MSSAKEGQEVQETSCSEYSSQCPAKDETCWGLALLWHKAWNTPQKQLSFQPSSQKSSSQATLELCIWEAARILPRALPTQWHHAPVGQGDHGPVRPLNFKAAAKQKRLPPNLCLQAGVSWKNITCGDTWEEAENAFFFLPGWFITSCLNLTRCLQCWKRWKDEGFIYLKSYETFLWWGTSGKGRPKAGATRHNLNLCGWSSWTDPLVSPLWTPQRGLMPPCSHLSSASWHHRRLRSLNPLGQQCGGGSAGDCCAFPAT